MKRIIAIGTISLILGLILAWKVHYLLLLPFLAFSIFNFRLLKRISGNLSVDVDQLKEISAIILQASSSVLNSTFPECKSESVSDAFRSPICATRFRKISNFCSAVVCNAYVSKLSTQGSPNERQSELGLVRKLRDQNIEMIKKAIAFKSGDRKEASLITKERKQYDNLVIEQGSGKSDKATHPIVEAFLRDMNSLEACHLDSKDVTGILENLDIYLTGLEINRWAITKYLHQTSPVESSRIPV